MRAEPLNLRETQLESLRILRLFDEICSELNLSYWLMYGSLIGAIRHNGFIPWDDDLDVGMPRDDFNKLIDFFDKNSSKCLPFVLINYDGSRREVPFLIARLSNTEFKQIGEYGFALQEMGTFIDIYPFDGMGDNQKEAYKFKKRCESHVKDYVDTCYFKMGNKLKDPLRFLKKKIKSKMIGPSSLHLKRLTDELETYSYANSTYVGNCTWNYGFPNDFYRREDFDEVIRIQFEDFSAPVPIGFDRVLATCYGDYMQLPPEEERIGHHYYSIVRRA